MQQAEEGHVPSIEDREAKTKIARHVLTVLAIAVLKARPKFLQR
jgi:hypothetical protein